MTATAEGLAEFYTVEEIRAFWQAVLAARMSRSSVNLHIHQISNPDGRASAALTLSTVAEQERFMDDCRAAIALKESKAPQTPRVIDFSQRRLEY